MINLKKQGIMLAGNILTDTVKMIKSYPEKGMLSTITSLKRAVGGSVPNSGIDLAVIDRALPVYACGMVGNDDNGDYVINEMKKVGINTEAVRRTNDSTSFSDVMTIENTGERTFFHYRGANARFSIDDIDIENLSVKMFHFGYLLLLDRFEEYDSQYGNMAGKLLAKVSEKGIKTSIDVVSESSGRFEEVVIPTLKYCNYVIINEIEACSVSKNTPRDNHGNLIDEEIVSSMKFLLSKGVKDCVIVHAPEKGYLLRADGTLTIVPSLKLPSGYIKGSVGAGDAFCAGALYGLYNEWDDERILSFSASSAACNLSEADSVSGMKSKEEIEKLYEKYHR